MPPPPVLRSSVTRKFRSDCRKRSLYTQGQWQGIGMQLGHSRLPARSTVPRTQNLPRTAAQHPERQGGVNTFAKVIDHGCILDHESPRNEKQGSRDIKKQIDDVEQKKRSMSVVLTHHAPGPRSSGMVFSTRVGVCVPWPQGFCCSEAKQGCFIYTARSPDGLARETFSTVHRDSVQGDP